MACHRSQSQLKFGASFSAAQSHCELQALSNTPHQYQDLESSNARPIQPPHCAVVTGGGGGIGRAVSLFLAEAGAAVAVLDKDEPKAQATASAIGESGGQAIAIGVDVTDEANVIAALTETARQFGGIDIPVNNA
eukprot:gene9813-13130_t